MTKEVTRFAEGYRREQGGVKELVYNENIAETVAATSIRVSAAVPTMYLFERGRDTARSGRCTNLAQRAQRAQNVAFRRRDFDTAAWLP